MLSSSQSRKNSLDTSYETAMSAFDEPTLPPEELAHLVPRATDERKRQVPRHRQPRPAAPLAAQRAPQILLARLAPLQLARRSLGERARPHQRHVAHRQLELLVDAGDDLRAQRRHVPLARLRCHHDLLRRAPRPREDPPPSFAP